jgi:hypothetical protein
MTQTTFIQPGEPSMGVFKTIEHNGKRLNVELFSVREQNGTQAYAIARKPEPNIQISVFKVKNNGK